MCIRDSGLFRTPPCEPKRVLGLDLGDLLGDLEQGRRTAAVVLYAWASLDRVQVSTGHDNVVVVLAWELGDHVHLGPTLGGIDVDECSRAWLRQRDPVGKRGTDNRDVD